MHLPTKGSSASTHLDLMRGIAALLVAFGHARALLIEPAGNGSNISLFGKVFYFLTSLGSSSVMIFFVLSGFLIGTSVIEDLRRGRWVWKKYIISRASRIYTVLFPALALGLVLDFIGTHYFGSSAVYSLPRYGAVLPDNVLENISASIFFGNMVCLQTIFVPTLGSNGPLWSLANEVWYYVLFPLLAVAIWPGTTRLMRMGLALLALGVLGLITPSMRLLFLVWLMGAGLSVLPARRISFWLQLTVLGTLIAALAMNSLRVLGDFGAYTVGGLTAGLVYCIASSNHKPLPSCYVKFATLLSSVSYTVYLVHLPFIILISAAFLGDQGNLPANALGLFYTLSLVLFALVYALGIWGIFERRTPSVKIWLLKKTGLTPP